MPLHRLLALLLALGPALPAAAQERAAPLSSKQDERGELQQVVASQLAAFGRSDGPAAFALASPMIQGKFGDAATFLRMVQRGYTPLIRPRSVRFVGQLEVAGEPALTLVVVGRDGKSYGVVYMMTRMASGAWRTNGCELRELAPPDA